MLKAAEGKILSVCLEQNWTVCSKLNTVSLLHTVVTRLKKGLLGGVKFFVFCFLLLSFFLFF